MREISELPIKGAFLTLQIIFAEFIRKQTCSHPDALKFFLRNDVVVFLLSVHPLSSWADFVLLPLREV